jgi:hypothetical protein
MKLTFLLLCFFYLLNISNAWTAPATNLQLNYDSKKIDIDADHPSDRLDRNFIQKVVVTRNSKDKQIFYFTHQTSASKFITTLDYAASPGDHLDIELYSSEGGLTQSSIDVP